MKLWTFLAVLLLACAPCFAQAPLQGVTLKVRVEANEFDKKLLLEKLNDNGKDHHLTFVAADEGYDYRIEFKTFQQTTAEGSRRSAAKTTVYDKDGNDLFRFSRDSRYTDTGATNAVAKEIIKRLRELK